VTWVGDPTRWRQHPWNWCPPHGSPGGLTGHWALPFRLGGHGAQRPRVAWARTCAEHGICVVAGSLRATPAGVGGTLRLSIDGSPWYGDLPAVTGVRVRDIARPPIWSDSERPGTTRTCGSQDVGVRPERVRVELPAASWDSRTTLSVDPAGCSPAPTSWSPSALAALDAFRSGVAAWAARRTSLPPPRRYLQTITVTDRGGAQAHRGRHQVRETEDAVEPIAGVPRIPAPRSSWCRGRVPRATRTAPPWSRRWAVRTGRRPSSPVEVQLGIRPRLPSVAIGPEPPPNLYYAGAARRLGDSDEAGRTSYGRRAEKSA
jgi:hypothetical protein